MHKVCSGGARMEILGQDLRLAIRALARNPSFAIITSLVLALGIGANTAIFTVVNSVLLRPLAYCEARQLYLIQVIWLQMAKFYPLIPANLPGFRIWQKECHSFESIAIAEGASAGLTGVGDAVEIHGVRASANLFDVLGVLPKLGRSFRPEEDETGRGRVVTVVDTASQKQQKENSMQNAHERFGMLELTKRTKDSSTRLRIQVERRSGASKERTKPSGRSLDFDDRRRLGNRCVVCGSCGRGLVPNSTTKPHEHRCFSWIRCPTFPRERDGSRKETSSAAPSGSVS